MNLNENKSYELQTQKTGIMFKIYFIKKLLFSALFTLTSTNLMALSAVVEKSNLKFEDILTDYLFLFFLVFGLIISMAHEVYSMQKKDIKASFALVLLSVATSIGFTALIWVLFKNGVIPKKFYYTSVLFTSVFSPGLVRYFLTNVPTKIGGKLLDSLAGKIDSQNSESNTSDTLVYEETEVSENK